MIEIQIILEKLEVAKAELRKSLKKGKYMTIQQNNTLYKEIDTKELLNNGNSSDNDVTIVDLLEKNNILSEEVRGMKREHEIQSV